MDEEKTLQLPENENLAQDISRIFDELESRYPLRQLINNFELSKKFNNKIRTFT